MWLRAKVSSRPSGVTRLYEKSAPALLISTSMRGSLAAIAAPTLRVSAMFERSARCTRWPSPGAFASSLRIVACARASSRATKTIRAPRPASTRTAASPMPDVAPVATMVLPFIERILQLWPQAPTLNRVHAAQKEESQSNASDEDAGPLGFAGDAPALG